MSSFRKVTENFYVSPQITPEDVEIASDEGFGLIIINRPDAEMFGQPSTAEIEDVAKSKGIEFLSIPITTPPEMVDINATLNALEAHDGSKVLAFCRSGTRSVTLWAYAMAKLGTLDVSKIISCAADAGYDLSGHSEILNSFTKES